MMIMSVRRKLSEKEIVQYAISRSYMVKLLVKKLFGRESSMTNVIPVAVSAKSAGSTAVGSQEALTRTRRGEVH